jgi:predicted HicB family RNase H-like nuclease
MNYRGLKAVINWCEVDNIYFGKVEGIKDSITFEGITKIEVARNFKEAVNHYKGLRE